MIGLCTKLSNGVLSWLTVALMLNTACGTPPLTTETININDSAATVGDQKTAANESTATSGGEQTKTAANSTTNWKVLLLSGDSSIQAFDNARKEVDNILTSKGIEEGNISHLSATNSEINGSVLRSTAQNIESALMNQNVQSSDACLIYMTSHGSRQGFFLQSQPTLLPAALDSLITKTCGTQPTVVLISACYSGLFAGAVMQKENRIILTAAASDRTSFGCGVESQYTYWDACLIDSLPSATSWKELSDDLTSCIEAKERNSRVTPSNPQAFFGSATGNIALIGL